VQEDNKKEVTAVMNMIISRIAMDEPLGAESTVNDSTLLNESGLEDSANMKPLGDVLIDGDKRLTDQKISNNDIENKYGPSILHTERIETKVGIYFVNRSRYDH
jgi:hypothetical protein